MLLTNVSLRVHPGECVCVVGNSGSGKSLLLSLLLGALRPTEGVVAIDGADLSMLPGPVLDLYRQRLGVVFQERALLDDLTIEQNVSLPLELVAMSPSTRRKLLSDILLRSGLLGLTSVKARDASQAARSLTALARALVRRPSVLLLDEPMTALDADQRMLVLSLLRDARSRGATIILFARDESAFADLAPRVVRLAAGSILKEKVPTREQPSPAQAPRQAGIEEAATLSSVAPVERNSKIRKPIPVRQEAKKVHITAIGS